MFRCESHLRQSQKVFENEFEFSNEITARDRERKCCKFTQDPA